MKDLATGGFSHAQIYDALHGRSGTLAGKNSGTI